MLISLFLQAAGEDLVTLSSSITATDVSLKLPHKNVKNDINERNDRNERKELEDSPADSQGCTSPSTPFSQPSISSSSSQSLSLSSSSSSQSEKENLHQQCPTNGEVNIVTNIQECKVHDPSMMCKRKVEDRPLRPVKTTLGIRQIWVHNKHRRCNIARTLVDSARKHFFFGTIVMRSQVAFSQPTSDGLKFALAYSHQDTVWAYA